MGSMLMTNTRNNSGGQQMDFWDLDLLLRTIGAAKVHYRRSMGDGTTMFQGGEGPTRSLALEPSS